MKRETYGAAVASGWVLAVSVAALATGVTSPGALAGYAIVALVPSTVMHLLWRDPPQTMSEAIREARR